MYHGQKHTRHRPKHCFVQRCCMAVAVAVLGSICAAGPQEAAAQTAEVAPAPGSVVVGHRPSAPYRVWYGVNDLGPNEELFPNMTINTGGKVDARQLEPLGVATLEWAYGSQIGWESGPKYWIERLHPNRRMRKPNEEYNYTFIFPGIGIDEFAGAKHKEVWSWIQQGLKAGRSRHPEVFVAAWLSNTVRPEIFEMGREGSIDLFMVQGYTITKNRGDGVYWSDAMARMEAFQERGLINKTVFTLGHITDYPNWKGGAKWNEIRLRMAMAEVKRRFPGSPGISFFKSGEQDPDELRRLTQLVDRLSKEFWPDNWLPDAIYSLTPQNGTAFRLETDKDSQTPRLWKSRFPEVATSQMWRFTNVGEDRYRIQPAESKDLSLEATESDEAGVTLVANSEAESQLWVLTPVPTGFTISPASMPDRFLEATTTSNGATVRLAPQTHRSSQNWAISPEFSPLEPIPPVYHGEKAEFAGGTKRGGGNPGSVGGYISQSKDGGTLTFQNVDGGVGGMMGLTFRYANGDNRPRVQQITVNGRSGNIAFQPTGGWGTWESYTFRAPLKPGETNTIVLTTTGNGGPDIDKLTIEPLH